MTTAEDNLDDAREARSEDRTHGQGREALLDAAIHVVATRGLRSLTYRAVAEKAGVVHGLVMHHFGSRDALVEAALQFSLERTLHFMADQRQERGIPALLDTLVDLIRVYPDDQAFQFELTLESRRRPELRPHIERLYQSYRELVRDELTGGGSPADDDLVHLVVSAIDGLLFAHLCFSGDEAARSAQKRLRQLLTNDYPFE
ncbi:MAG: putative TetR family transcriptional regulator [Nocardioidaceae bacterium]|nr:putative TetR family transcriptional regulator [Nocardioidaceae bacterium]